jgi:two-component system sensor histidine kinase BaeS
MKIVLAALGTATAALISAEVVMQPSGTDRLLFVAIVAGALALAGGVGVWLHRSTRQLASLRASVLTMTLATVGLVAAVVGASAGLMFLSPHDLRVVLIALLLAVGLGFILSTSWTNGLRDDLNRLRAATEQVGAGDLQVSANNDRKDELGELARAFDAMTAQLQEATASREHEEEVRRAFLAAVSHDLRTPLTAMRVALEALEDGMAPEPDRYLRSLSRDVEALARLVDDLFLLSRIEAGRLELCPEPVDVAELVDEAIEALRPIAERHRIHMELHRSGDTMVSAGPAELGRVVRNLLDNAIRHAPPHSAVDVSVGRHNGTVSVSVADEGPGFPNGFRRSAVKQFARADAARTRGHGGAGLGLAIAGGLIDAHGGTLHVGEGPGGRVSFLLPLGGVR